MEHIIHTASHTFNQSCSNMLQHICLSKHTLGCPACLTHAPWPYSTFLKHSRSDFCLINLSARCKAVHWGHGLMCRWNSSSRPVSPALNTPLWPSSRANMSHCSRVFVKLLKWPSCCRSCTVWGLLHMVLPPGSWVREREIYGDESATRGRVFY